MSRNALDVAKQALALWRANYGNESLDQQCQRYDGYYWQWAYQGNENIRTYGTATAAARASEMFTYDINHASIAPGDLVYWDWGTDGHVGTVIGRQNGRTIVTHTSSKGDTLLDLGNHVKVSHADSIGLTFRGVAHTNGANSQRTGLTGWSPNEEAADGWERAPGGEPGAPMWPVGALMARIQRGLSLKKRYNYADGSPRPADGIGGKYTAEGIQRTLNHSRKNGKVPYVPTAEDSKLGLNNGWGVQHYGKAYGDYDGRMDGDPRGLSWTAFALGLERP